MNRESTFITLIAAMSRNRVIGRAGALPWRMPADMQRFKRRTMGSAVIMGRKTWDALGGRALPGRTNIIVTRDSGFTAAGAVVAHDLAGAIQAARAAHPEATEIFVAGGGEMYRLALPVAHRIDLTVIDTEVTDGDAFFPTFEHDESWRLVSEQSHPADERNAHASSFRMYERQEKAGA